MGQFRWLYILFSVIALLNTELLSAQFEGGDGRGDALCFFETPYSPMYFGGSGNGDAICSFYNPSAPYYSGGNGRGDAICRNFQATLPLFDGGEGRGDAICQNEFPPMSIFSGGIGRGDAMCFEDETPLPISLNYFRGTCWGNEVSLEWATFSEINNDYFVIEKTVDGQSWSSIDTVFGGGTTSNYIIYNTVDPRAEGINYYRLRQVDYNGDSETFEIISISCEEKELAELTVYPNPNNGVFKVEGFGESAKLIVYDGMGKLVMTQDVQSNVAELDLSLKEPGVYLLKVYTESHSWIARVVISPSDSW